MELDDFMLARVEEANNTDVEKFTCGNDDLDAFLKEDAKSYAENGITFTTVVQLQETTDLCGFFSLSTDSLKLTGIGQTELGLPFTAPFDFFPAVKITKFAVSAQHQRQGIGSAMMKLIQGIAFNMAGVSSRLLTVNSLNKPETISFYEALGFIKSDQTWGKRAPPPTVLMYRDLYKDS